MRPTYYVETWGCQMNVLDSQHLSGIMQDEGYREVEAPEAADVVLLNTCSVREKAVQKVLSRLGELRRLRRDHGRPGVVGLCGCVAEQEGAALLARSEVVSFVLGPGKYSQLPALIEAAALGRRRSLTGFTEERDYDSHLIARGSGARQLVTVVHGCNQHCTFCVVPYTRGHEVSRSIDAIVGEVRTLVGDGARHITLLGQTVNAYSCPDTGAAFADLVSAVDDVAGLWKFQFITSHPRFFDTRLIDAMARARRLGSYLHLPFQAGSDRILRAMHRRYSRAEYLDIIAALRSRLPTVSLSTDVIVGFPGELDEDFDETLGLLEEVRYSQLFGFIYSPRPKTPAARYDSRVPRAVAGQRLETLFAVQERIQLELNQALIGSEVEVLIDGPARRGESLWQGRGADGRVVNFPAWDGIGVGQLETLRITGASPHSLAGERAESVLSESA